MAADMSEQKIKIDASSYPVGVFINGEEYDVFCEYRAKDGDYRNVYSKTDGNDVVVCHENKGAIVGLFSTEQNNLKNLFDYIEATIPTEHQFDSLITDFKEKLKSVTKINSSYPMIHHAIGEPNQSLVSNFISRISKSGTDEKELFNRVHAHMVEVEFVDRTYDVDIGNDEFMSEMFSEIVGSKTSPAEKLPAGWNWEEFNDGSGSLNSPDGKSYFSYDLAPYANERGIEYKADKDSGWDVFWGVFDDFKKHAESLILERGFDEISIPDIMDTVSNNAWYGKEPTKICYTAGEHAIEMEGHTYEPSYEYFTADASLTFNDQVLYGKDGRCVDAYKYEEYDTGIYSEKDEAIAFVKEQTKGLRYMIADERKEPVVEKAGLDAMIAAAKDNSKGNQKEGSLGAIKEPVR